MDAGAGRQCMLPDITWLANTSQGRMVGDYISTSFSESGSAHGVFAVATAPNGGTFNEAMFTTAAGITRRHHER